MKDFKEFKKAVEEADKLLIKCGYTFNFHSFHAKSPFQKRRYKDEYVFPECWARIAGMEHGIVVNGESLENAEDIKNYLLTFL